MKVSKDKTARDHLSTKYRWVPNAIAVYVPTKEAEGIARKVLLQKYGKAKNDIDPIWPDGSSMRFLPIKGSGIKNERTREIVRKRMAYHIWQKAHEVTIDTNFKNIHDTIESFQGKAFSEIILELSNEDEGSRYFTHFNRAWSADPMIQCWQLSVRSHLFTEARTVMGNIKEYLVDVYGIEVEHFFSEEKNMDQPWMRALTSGTQDDDENWFDEDEDYVEIMIEKGIVDSSFLQFLNKNGEDSDKQSVASWGTGETAYMEMVNVQPTNDTSTSSLTESTTITTGEKQERIQKVKTILQTKGLLESEIEAMCASQSPYELTFSGVHLSSWDTEKEVFLLMAIRNQYHTTLVTKNDEQK